METDTKKEHICSPPTTTPRSKEIYLGAQNDNAKLARDYDEFFTSKRLSDLKTEAKQLERYNKTMSYGKKQELMGSGDRTSWTDMPPNQKRRTK